MENIRQEVFKKAIDDLILMSQTLCNEEIIHKNTYDKIYEKILDIKKNAPSTLDLIGEVWDKGTKVLGMSIGPLTSAKQPTEAHQMIFGNFNVIIQKRYL